MRRLLVLLALALAAPLSAQSFSGCGATYGTCASVTIAAVPLPDGSWSVTVTLANTSGVRSGMASEFFMNWEGGGPSEHISEVGPITDGHGADVGLDFAPTSGWGIAGFVGYTEMSDDDGNVVWGRFAGAESSDCAADPACAALRVPTRVIPGGPTTEFGYHPGPITFRFTLDSPDGFDPATITVSVATINIDGSRSQGEFYVLDRTPVTVTPEPVTLTLLASGLAGVGLARRRRRQRSTDYSTGG